MEDFTWIVYSLLHETYYMSDKGKQPGSYRPKGKIYDWNRFGKVRLKAIDWKQFSYTVNFLRIHRSSHIGCNSGNKDLENKKLNELRMLNSIYIQYILYLIMICIWIAIVFNSPWNNLNYQTQGHLIEEAENWK